MADTYTMYVRACTVPQGLIANHATTGSEVLSEEATSQWGAYTIGAMTIKARGQQ